MGLKEKYNVRLTSEERKALFELIGKGRANKGKLNRARILLKADCGERGENWTDDKISEALYVSPSTVRNTRKSLVEEGLEKTLNNEIPLKARRKRIIQGEGEAHLVALACSEAPEGRCNSCSDDYIDPQDQIKNILYAGQEYKTSETAYIVILQKKA